MALGLVAKLYGKERASLLAHSLEYEWNDDPANDPFAIKFPKDWWGLIVRPDLGALLEGEALGEVARRFGWPDHPRSLWSIALLGIAVPPMPASDSLRRNASVVCATAWVQS